MVVNSRRSASSFGVRQSSTPSISGSRALPGALPLAALPAAIVLALAAWSVPSALAAEASSAVSDSVVEITVSARRRDESLQRVPAAVSVLQGDLLERAYTVNTRQLSELIPSLYYNSANPRNTAYTLRGLGSNSLSISAANDGIEPGVGFYMDQVYHARPATAAFDFTDIERVEVLRGPQGTLFGKNTTGGALHVLSRLPTFTPEAAGELSVGENGWQQARGSVSGPLGERLAARLSVQGTQRDGLLHNVRTGNDLNTVDNYAVRGQLLWQPSPALSLRLTADASDLASVCCTQSFLRVGTSLRSPARQFPALAAGLGYAPPSRDVYDRLSDIDVEPMIDTQDGGVSLIADWQMGAGTLTSVSAWRYWDWDVGNDRDYTGIPIQLVQRIPSRQDQYSQELRYASDAAQRLRHVSGLYWFKQDIGGSPTSVYGPEAAYWLLNQANFTVPLPRNLLDGYAQTGRSQFEMRSRAAFAEANYDLTPALVATLGLRYTREDKRGHYATQVSGGPDLSGLPAASRNELTRARLSIFRPQNYSAQDAQGNLSGRANLAWQVDDALLTYVSAAYGYKSGGLNMSGLPLDAANRPALATAIIDDERNTTLELGVKSTLLQGRATLNLAAFHTRVRDYQTNVVSSLETAALRSYPANVPEVRVRGLEADLLAAPLDGLTLRAALAYADGQHRDYPAGPCPLEVQTAGTAACDLSGTPLPGLSRWVGSIGVDYRLPLGTGELVWHLDALARSGYNSDTAGSRYTAIAGHALANASVGYQFQNGWFVDVFARNLFDREYLSALTVQTGNSGLILGQPGDPRLLGVSLRVRW